MSIGGETARSAGDPMVVVSVRTQLWTGGLKGDVTGGGVGCGGVEGYNGYLVTMWRQVTT